MSTKKPKQEKRPSSDNFVDLHVFVVPYELWMERYRTAYNSSTLESISAGFVRVPPQQTLDDLRNQIGEQLNGGGILPDEYVFLRCVGRCLAIVNKIQELSLKVKHFLPPIVSSPEIFVLYGNHSSLSQTLASSINTGSDLQDYGTVQEYLTYTKEKDENSRFSPPGRFNNEHFDTDAMQRHVHFEHSTSDNVGKDNLHQDLKRNPPDDIVIDRRIKQTHSTELPQDTKPHMSDEPQHKLSSMSNSRQDNQNLYSENRRISFELPNDNGSQGNQDEIDHVNGVITRNNGRNSHDDKQIPSSLDDKQMSSSFDDKQMSPSFDDKQMSSSFDDKQHHAKNDKRNKIPKKNPLLHSKTAPSLFQTSKNKNFDEGDTEKGADSKKTENAREINSESVNDGVFRENLNGRKENEYLISNEYPDPLGISNKIENEVAKKTKENFNHPGSEDESINQTSYQKGMTAEKDGCEETSVVVDLTKDIIKHSADNSVASSGFESLSQSNNNNNRPDVEKSKNDFGVTIADKENLVLQLQAELNAVRSERSDSEKSREQLLKKVKNIQNHNNQKRNQAKTVWKKKYFEEKKKTVSLEERCNQLRYEVEVIHKKIFSAGDSAKDRGSASSYLNKDGNPQKLNARITLTRKENEVEELRRRVEEAKIKLGSEMKLRDNAQKELKQIRDEVIDKKINATLVKKSLSLLETRSPNDT
ncbi:spermatogenesis-associated protein 1-like isoform X2 [Dendronephthya gigantea]|uniref:spermatogenesis-associated protein 1-like isoform X2 n=1 Tax=Dendronephthya gigantea TaxID=151771 RepID=UPI0010695374|nr:spermatogenesis-associated protein 1-like isoform X2 [Dendronephthya gigantea]